MKLKNKLTIYPTNTTLITGKINYAPLCEVNRLYEEHEEDFTIFTKLLLAKDLHKSLDGFDCLDKLITFWCTLGPGNLKPLAI